MEEINQNSQTSLDFNLDILKPNSEKDIQEIIKYCYKKDLPIEIIGAGSKNQIGKKLPCAKTLDMSNFSGKVHGGTILKLLDEAAFTCASRYCKTYVVTKSLDQVVFKNPIAVAESKSY